MNRIFKSGYSRIPIYDRDPNDVIGVILTKDLLFIDPEDDVPIKSFTDLFCRPIQSVWPDQKLGDVLLLFRHSKGHMAVVRDVESSGNVCMNLYISSMYLLCIYLFMYLFIIYIAITVVHS